jgi:4-carboxymuconolactone decarboxylase
MGRTTLERPAAGGSMSRVVRKTREELDLHARAVYDEIFASRGKVDDAFQPLLTTPDLLQRVVRLGTYIRFESGLDAETRECVILATAQYMRSEFEWQDHEIQARKAGVAAETIEAIRTQRNPDACSPEIAAVLRFCRETLIDKEVSDEAFRQVEAAYGTRGVAEIAATIGFYCMLAVVLTAYGVKG